MFSGFPLDLEFAEKPKEIFLKVLKFCQSRKVGALCSLT